MPDLAAIVARDPVLSASIALSTSMPNGLSANDVIAHGRVGTAEDITADLIAPFATAVHTLADRYGMLLNPSAPCFEQDEHGTFTGRALVTDEMSPIADHDRPRVDAALRDWITAVVDAATAAHSRDALDIAAARVLARIAENPPPQTSRLPHHRTLLNADLAVMHVRRGLDRLRIDLDDPAARRLLDDLCGDSAMASDRIGRDLSQHFTDSTPQGIADALHHLLTAKRFRKGPRGHLSVDTVTAAVAAHLADGRPVPLILQGFPFKQSDNGLKATGRLPDLGEFGTLLRLTELHRAFSRVYPPGFVITIVSDGGYYRPRPFDDTGTYLAGLDEHLKVLDATDTITITPRAGLVGEMLSTAEQARRAELIADVRAGVSAAVAPARDRWDIEEAAVLATTGDLADVTGPVLPFWRIFRSLLSSEPVENDDGTIAGPDWARKVLADPFDMSDDVPEALRRARGRLMADTWADTAGYLAVLAADQHSGIDDRVFTGVRLATGAPRPGLAGFSFLGGSTLLPWHGTGCTDVQGMVSTDFRVALRDRCFVPVYTPLAGSDQPFMMVPFAATEVNRSVRVISPGFGLRLRSR